MNPLDDEAREARRKAEAREAKRRMQQERDDFRALLALPAMQRTLLLFLDESMLDATCYREKPTAMAFVAGWQDAARWFVHRIRAHCPEREAQMRALANKLAREGVSEKDDGPESDDE